MRLGGLGILVVALLAPLPALAQTTVHYDWLTQGEVSGELVLTIHEDGERSAGFRFNDRGRGPNLDERYRVDAGGLIRTYEVRGHASMGAPVAERFVFEAGVASWRSELESGRAEGELDAFYLANDGTPEQTAALARALLARPDRTLELWPSGTARTDKVASESVTYDGERVDVDLYAISGLGFGPSYVWLDRDGELFAISLGWMGLTPKGWSAVLPRLAERQRAAEEAHWSELAAELTHATPDAFCLRDFAVLDVDAGRVAAGQTVRVEDGTIAAVGADGAIDCRGLAAIDGEGRTLMPGLWDMHVHIDIADGPLHIAAGVTTVRDLANDHDRLMGAIEWFRSGDAIGPEVHRAGFIDARGPYAAPTGNLAGSLDEAMEFIGAIDARGYPQVKIYSSIPTDWVAPMAAEIHRRGMRLSGHIPTGMSAAEAVRSGYDEIQHINMLFLNFLAGPDDDTRTPLRFSLVAERGATLDLDSPEVREFIALLDARDIVVDPTVAIFDDMFRHRSGEISPSYAAIADHLPPNVRRGMLAGRMDIHDGNAGRYAASAGALLAMIRRLHEAGVPLVAGTDALAGFTLHRELELYAEAGIPNADVLRIATIGSARVVGADDRVGRIAPGYTTDLIALDGNPLADIGALRRTALTLKGRRLYRPAELHRALGMEPFVEPVPLPVAGAADARPPVDRRYLGQRPPGTTPEPFAPGIVNTEAIELNGVFSPDFREFFFSRLIEGDGSDDGYIYPGDTRPVIFHSVFADGAWSAPRPLLVYPDRGRAMAVDMALSVDGRELYFLGQHPDGEASLDLWVSRRVDGAWSTAEAVPPPVSTGAREVYPVAVADGSLYFTSNRPGGLAEARSDLYRARRLADGGFAEPVDVGPPINSEHGVGDTFVAPDESYMVLTSSRPGGYGSGDLFVSFRQADGGWGAPIDLGPDVNSDGLEYCPMVTPDGRYLFFSRRRSDPPGSGWPNVVEGDVYWVDAVVLERLRPTASAAADRP